jgi:16S rRNA (guanine(966)-N(2))-methyltransferase RsmD
MPRGNKQAKKSLAEKKRAAITATSAAAAPDRSLSTRLASRTKGAAPGRVRIVGGIWKRTPIAVADLPGLRPTSDRVRETLFNWLSFLRPQTQALRGLDLFAGTGVLGFELASRGAASVVLVEREPLLVERLRALKERLNAGQVEILPGDAFRVAARLVPGTFDIVFLDPPFDSRVLNSAIERVRTLLAPEGLVYAESDIQIDAEQARNLGLELLRAGQAGRVRFHLLRREGS